MDEGSIQKSRTRLFPTHGRRQRSPGRRPRPASLRDPRTRAICASMCERRRGTFTMGRFGALLLAAFELAGCSGSEAASPEATSREGEGSADDVAVASERPVMQLPSGQPFRAPSSWRATLVGKQQRSSKRHRASAKWATLTVATLRHDDVRPRPTLGRDPRVSNAARGSQPIVQCAWPSPNVSLPATTCAVP